MDHCGHHLHRCDNAPPKETQGSGHSGDRFRARGLIFLVCHRLGLLSPVSVVRRRHGDQRPANDPGHANATSCRHDRNCRHTRPLGIIGFWAVTSEAPRHPLHPIVLRRHACSPACCTLHAAPCEAPRRKLNLGRSSPPPSFAPALTKREREREREKRAIGTERERDKEREEGEREGASRAGHNLEAARLCKTVPQKQFCCFIKHEQPRFPSTPHTKPRGQLEAELAEPFRSLAFFVGRHTNPTTSGTVVKSVLSRPLERRSH